MRQASVLGLLVCLIAAVNIQGKQDASSPTLLGRALHLDALGAPKPDAPLARRTAPGVDVRIERSGFEVAGPTTLVSLSGLDTGRAGWARFARGASRRTPFGRETIVIAPQKTEQYLTIDRHQGKRTWRWRLVSPGIAPRVGDDGAVSFVRGHGLAPVHIAPVQILDAEGADVTPSDLRWSVRRAGNAWSLELRLDDSRLPTPYVIDPAVITQRSAATFANSAGLNVNTFTFYKPIGIATNDIMIAGVLAHGNRTITPPSGWTSIRRDAQGVNLTQELFYKVAAPNEPGSYTFTFSASDKVAGGIIPYVGVDDAVPIDQSSGNTSTSNSANVVALSITTTGANYMVAGFFSLNKTATFTPPAGMNEEWDTTTTGTAFEAADYTAAAAGPTGNKTAVASTAHVWIGQLVSLKLDSAAPTQALSVTEGTRPDLQYFNSGTNTMYYSPAAAGDFSVTSSITDEGASQVTFPAISATGFTHTAAYRNQVLADEPIAYWRLGESSGTSAADTSGNGNTGTYGGGPTLGATGALAGDSDTATSFDGVNDNVSVPDSAALDLNGSFSIEFWAKQTSFTNTSPGIVNKGSSTTADGYLISAGNTGILTFKRNNVTVATAAGALTAGYKHFVLTYDGATVRWYVNGVAGTSSALALPANASTAALTIGLGDAGQYANDAIDDVAVYQTALSTTRIAEHYNVGISSSRDEIDTNSPFTSANYSFGTSNTTAPGASTITGVDGAGSSVTTNLTFVRDVTAPTGMSATVTGGYYTSLSVPVTVANGSDTESGIDATTAIVERDEVALANNTCPAFGGAWSTVTLSGGNDTTVQSGKCYRYRYKISDRVGNQGTSSASATVKIDTSAPTPAPSLAYGSFSNAALFGGVVYYRPGAASGQFAVTGSGSADPESGISGYNFPAAAGGWSRSVAGATATYSHTGSPTDPAEPNNVTASDNAGLTSSATSFTVTPDSSAPTGQSVALSGGPYYTSLSVALTPTDGSDTGSGVDTATRVYERDTGTLSNGNCSGFPGTWATTVSNPDTSVVSGNCYRYRLKISDRVGNQSAASGASADAKVDTSAPSDPTFTYGSFSNATVVGGVVYYSPGAASGQFAVTASSTDAQSGITGYTFPAAAGGWSRSIAGATATYSHTGSPTDPAEPNNVTAQNNAGLSSNATSFTVTPDSSLPASAIQCNGAACSAGWYTSSPVSVTLSASDTGSGVSQIKYTTDGSVPTLGNGTVYLGAFNVAVTTTVKYRAWDHVGNAEAVQTKLIQVDTTAPTAPTLSFSALTNAFAAGQTVYFRPGVAGGVTVTASSSDGESGVASYAFPALGSGWSGSQAGASYSYSFTNAAVDPTEPNNTTATNNAGLTSSPGAFTVTADGTAPVSSIACNGGACSGGWYTSTVSVSLSASDGGSGLQEIRFTTDGTDPSPINGTVYSAPFSVLVTTTVKFRAYDRVGNEEAVGSRLVQIDPSAPTGPALTLAESPSSPSQHVSGTTLYYNPQGGNAGTFTVDAATSDPESGVEKVTFPAVTGMTGGGDDLTNPYQGSYSWTASTTGSGAQTVTARNNAALTSSANFTVTPDTTAPGSQTAALVGGPYYTSASVGFTTGDGSDSGAGLNTSSRLVERASATLANGNCTGGFSSFGGSYSSPDTSVVSGNCYRYRFTIADNVGNVSTAVVTADAKVDTSNPTATMGDPGANLRGTVALTSTTGDPESGIATVTYQHSPAGQNTWTANAASWDTTGVPDGLYDLRVVATNNAGTTTSSAIVANRRVDNTEPSASMDDPGSPLSDTVTLTSTASDVNGSGLDTAIFQYSYQGTGPWTTIGTDSSAPFSVDWDTTAELDGRYNLRVIVSDVAGNSTTSSTVANRKVQNLPPLVDITAPGNYINAASPSPFTITATAESPQFGVDNVEFFRCTDASANCSTGTFASIGVDFTSPYTGSWAQASEPEGNRALKAIVTDGDGGTSEDVLNVTIDRTAPGGSITAPGAGAYVGGATVAVSSDSGDALSGVGQVVFQRSPAGQSTWTAIATDTTPAYSVNWDTTSLSDGAFDLRAVTTDLAGNSFNGPTQSVNVDNTGPTATQDDPGANLRASATLSSSASDPAGIAQVVFQRSPAGQSTWTPIATDTTFPYSTSFDTTAVADGLYDFRIVATDTVGNSTSSAPVTNRRVDNTAPSGTMTSPGANIRATVSLGSTTSDSGSGMASVSYERSPAGQNNWTAIGTSFTSPYSLNFDTTAVGDGFYDFRAVATDAAGNSTTSAAVTGIRVDNTPPSATMNDPGANLGGTVGLTSTTSDGGSGINTVTYQYSQAGQNSWVTTPASWNTTLVGDGLYDLRVIATDNAGNSTTSTVVVNRRVDNGAPTLSISQPGAYINGTDADPFTVAASSPDTDLANVQFFACDNASANCSTGSWVLLGTDTSAPYTTAWALPGADRNRALKAVATDLAANTGQDVHNVLVDRAAPSGGSVSYLDGYDTTGSLTITTSDGTDSGSGVDAPSGLLQRDAISLADGACGTFAGSWTSVTSPDPVASGNCYVYRYRISDLAGNTAIYTSGNVAKVDTSVPSPPTFSFSALTNAVASGQTVYFRPGLAGGFTLTASSSDAQSGIDSYAFPALGSGWSGTPSGDSTDYSFSSSAVDPVEPNDVSAQDNAGLISNPASFTVTADGTAPVSSIACDGAACTGGWYTSAVSVSLSASDGGSGLQEIRYTTDGSDPSPGNGTVYSGAFALSATTTVKFRAYDLLGNEEAVASRLVQVDTSAPSAPALSFGSFQNAVLAGGIVWYRPSAADGQFAVTASSSDSESGIAGYTFPAPATGWSRSISGATATYSHSGSPADPAEPNDVTAQNNAGLSSAPTSFTADPDGTAPSSSIACDGAACTGGWYTSAVSVSLSASDAGSGLQEIRYTTDGSDPSSGTGSVYSGAFAVASTTTVRYRAYDQVGNEEAVGQQLIRIDASAPAAPSLTLGESPASPNQHVSGTTLYYNPQGGNAGSFTVDAATSDPGSGIDRVSFASLTGMTGGGDDLASPYEAAYDWSASSSASGAQSVVAHNNAGLTSSASFTVTPDTTAPSGQTIDNDGGPYYTTLSVSLTIANGSDSGSGLDASSGVVERQSATLANDSCVSWSGFSPVALVGGADTSVVSGNCYRYRYEISDNVGNQSSPSASSGTAKVDTSAPSAPTLAFSALTNAAASGQTVYFRPGIAGGFTVTADSNDAQSGIDFYAFPALGSGWSSSQSGANIDFGFSSSAADPVEPLNATAQNNAGLASSPASLTVTPDGVAPVSSIACDGAACTGGWYTSAVSVALSASDAASGVQEIRYTTDGSDPSPGNGTVYSAPFSLGATTTVKFRAYDRVGNEETVGSQLVRIDSSAPAAPTLTLSESPASPNQHVSGTTLYYNPQGGNAGSFTVDAATSDAQSGIDRVTFPALGGMTGGGDDSSSPYQGSYSWTSASSATGSQAVTAHNNAGLTTAANFTVTADTAPPTGGSVSYPDGYASGSVTITTDDGNDALAGVDAATGIIERDSTNLVADTCDPFPGSWSAVTSPDSTIASGNCYRYRYRVSDNVGNNAVYISANVVKVSSSTPGAPTLTLAEAPGSQNQYVVGAILFYDPSGSNSGTFTVAADVTDSGGSGIDRVSFPSLGGMTGGGDDPTSPYQASYDWNSGSGASGAQTVTVHNNAGLTSSANFTVTPDSAPPTGQNATVTAGYYTSLSVPVSLQNGSDALSGIDPATAVLERETATLANGSCVAWSGSWNAVSLTGGADTTVQSNRCYHYRYSISDNVGNQSGPSATSADVKIDATTPVTGDDAPAGWRNAAVTVTLSVTETGSGVASTVHRVDGGSFQSGTSIAIPAPADHSNDGVHTIEYRTTDVAGNVESLRSATVRIDTTLPTTTDDAPAGWSSSPVTVTLSPADALSGIASTQYRIDGGAFQGGTSVAIPAPADHSNDGAHTIEYRSTDNAGNVEPLQTATVRVDTTLPAGALTAPANGAHVNGTVAIAASASDLPSGVASVEFLVRPTGAVSFSSISIDSTAPYDASWDSTAAPEGSADLKVVVLDNAGLSVTSAIRTIVVDNPPVPTLDDPGANVSGTVTLTASSQADTTQVVFERSPVGAGTWTQIATDTTAPFSANFDTGPLLDGNYDVRVVATDGGGFNGTSSLRTTRVDNTAPTVSVSDPAAGAIVGGPNVHLAALATDLGSGVTSVRFEQRPAGSGAFTAIATDTTDPYEASWNTTGLGGSYELRAVATDAAGNPATAATVPVTVNASAASVTFDDPGALLHGVVNLSASAPSAAVASVSFERRPAGGSWTRIGLDTTSPWGVSFDTKSVADGVYDLRAQALASNGQVLATHSRGGISIDNTAPTMLSATPADGTIVSPVHSIALVASEPVSAVQGAILDGSAATAQISGSNVTFSTSPLGSGTHALTGAFTDAAGNSGAFSVRFTVRVKAHATLSLRVNKPKTKTLSGGSKRVFLVSFFLSDPARVQATLLSPTGRRLRTLKTTLSAGRHSLRFILPTASLPPGRYTILVSATGLDGSKVVKRVYVTVAAKPATASKPAESTPVSNEVAIPIAPASGPSDGGAASPDTSAPPARTSKPEPKKQAPHAKSGALETASGSVSSSKTGHTALLVLILFSLGAAIAFLIKIEMGRMLASPRR
jgi:hypothetical protein